MPYPHPEPLSLFSLKNSPFNEHSGLIFFRMDWLDLLAVQGTLKSILQHHSSNASILQCSAFFMVQLSHPHMTTGKTIALTRWTFVGKVMSLLFNKLRGLKQTLCAPGPRDPTETETELCLSVSCGGTGRQWSAAGTGALGVGMA